MRYASRLTLALVVALAATATATPASAAIPTNVRIASAYCILDDCGENGAGVIGKVASKRKACHRGRSIAIIRKSGGSRDVVGRTTSDRRGLFEDKYSGSAGDRVLVRAAGKTLASGTRCAADRSRVRTVDGSSRVTGTRVIPGA